METALIWFLVASILSETVSGAIVTVLQNSSVSISHDPASNGPIRVISGMMSTDAPEDNLKAATLRKFIIPPENLISTTNTEQKQPGQNCTAVPDPLTLLKLLQLSVGKGTVKLEFTFYGTTNTDTEFYNVIEVYSSNETGVITYPEIALGRFVVLHLSVSKVESDLS